MRKLTLIIIAGLTLSFAFSSLAKEKKDKDLDEIVVLTRTDGTVQKGKVTKYWDALFKKGFNKTFSMTTDDGQKIKVDVEEIDSLYFPMRDSTHFRTYRPMYVTTPKIGNKNHTDKWICAVGKKSEHAQLYIPNVWVEVYYGTRARPELKHLPCIKFDGDTIAYPFYYYRNGGFNLQVMKHWTKETEPKLVDHLKAYFKSNKEAKKKLPDNPALMLDAYEDYLSKKSE